MVLVCIPALVSEIGFRLSHKSQKIESLVAPLRGRDLDAHYLAFFECFNQQRFFEAHEVLEVLWLPQRHGPNGPFYQGLIQLAGAFVHLQRERPTPAATLLKRAQANLAPYPATHERLDTLRVLDLITEWLRKLESSGGANPLRQGAAPELRL
ncbi:conserved hypothetical protein [Verrucomicrobia bacterium]|nr:conserved hypothetical protein [Verrucomicrobiota bacterium]